MKKTFEYALNGVADALMMKVLFDPFLTPSIKGQGSKTFHWFGADHTISPRIVGSIYNESRGIAVVQVHFSGNLYGILISDGDLNKLTLFLLDGGVKLPKSWDRFELYKLIVEKVKAIFVKKLNHTDWTLGERGNKLLRQYLEEKEAGSGLTATAVTAGVV